MPMPVDIEVIRAFLRTAYNGANEEYIDKFTPFILGNQTEKVIDLGVHFRVVRCSSKRLAKVLIQKEMEDDEYIIQTVGSRHVQQLWVAVKGFKKLLKIKDIDAHKVYRDMEKRVKACVVNMQEVPVTTPHEVEQSGPRITVSTPNAMAQGGAVPTSDTMVDSETPLSNVQTTDAARDIASTSATPADNASINLDDLIIEKLRATFTTPEQLKFVKDCYKYLRCNNIDMIVDIDDVADFIGSAKNALVSKLVGGRSTGEFVENQHYKIIEGIATGNGKLPTKYYLTTDTFKRLCMLSRTEKGAEVRNYFIGMEDIVHTILEQASTSPVATTNSRNAIVTRGARVRSNNTRTVAVSRTPIQSVTIVGSQPRPRVTSLVPIVSSNIVPIHGVPVNYKPANGIYVIEHGVCETTGNNVYEYGEGFVNDRVRKHLQEDKFAKAVILASVGSANSLPVEQTIKSVVFPHLVDICVNDKNKREFFAAPPEASRALLQKIVDSVLSVHKELIEHLQFDDDVIVDKTCSLNTTLEVEKQKTKTADANARIAEADSKARIAEADSKARIAEATNRKQVLDILQAQPDILNNLIQARPEMINDLIKLVQ